MDQQYLPSGGRSNRCQQRSMCHPFGAPALETAGPSKTNSSRSKKQMLDLNEHKGDDKWKGREWIGACATTRFVQYLEHAVCVSWQRHGLDSPILPVARRFIAHGIQTMQAAYMYQTVRYRSTNLDVSRNTSTHLRAY